MSETTKGSEDPRRKRVLSEIHINTDPPKGEKRRHSAGTEIMKTFQSRAGEKTASAGSSFRLPTGQFARPSSIPVASTSIAEPKPRIADIKTYLGIKNKLKQVYGKSSTALERTLPPKPPALSEEPDLHALETQVIQLADKIEDLEEEIDAILREQSKVRARISDINYQSLCQNRALERETDKLNKDRQHMEQMVQLQLRDLGVKLADDYNELKFNLQSEIEHAKQYQNESLETKIKELLSRSEKLKNQSDELQHTNQSKITQESNQLKEDLENYVTSQEQEADKLALMFETKDKEVHEVVSQLSEVVSQIQSRKEKNALLQSAISAKELNMSNFPATKATLLKTLTSVEDQLLTTRKIDEQWDQRVSVSQALHTTASQKMRQLEMQRRILENSIMDYEARLRVYVRVPERIDSSLNFNKVFADNVSNEYLAQEFSCLMKSSLNGSNISVVFTGKRENELLMSSIINSYKEILKKSISYGKWKFNFKFKSVEISGNQVLDLLDSSNKFVIDNPLDKLEQIQTQQMIIDNEGGSEEFERIIEQTQDLGIEVCAHMVSVHASKDIRTIKSDLLFLDLTGKEIKDQEICLNEMLRNESTSSGLQKFMNYASQRSKCLFICDLNVGKTANEGDITALLATHHKIHSTDSPYKPVGK